MIGEFLTKWTWLLDGVTVRGRVYPTGEEGHVGAPIGTVNEFRLELDANYRHLVNSSGPHGQFPGSIVVEAYPYQSGINRVEPWPLPDKRSDQEFMVWEPTAEGGRRPLRVGDYVQVIGRWVIENQHEDDCWSRWVGMCHVGCVFAEVHPFLWDEITLVRSQLGTADEEVEVLSLAAPIYEETFDRGGLQPCHGRVYIADDKSNYHRVISAQMHIQAPDLPRGFSRDASLIKWREDVLVNGTQLDPADLRTVSVLADGIQVDARLVAPERLHADPYLAAARAQSPFIAASIQDPAKGKSVFQARYRVGWKKRLSVQDLQQHVIESLQLTPQQAGTTSTFSFLLVNQGPDDLIVEQAYIYDDSSSSFKIDTIINRSIRAWSSLEVVGSFSAPPSLPGMFVTRPPYTVTARVRIKTNDPVEPYCEFFITGRATSPPLTADDVKVAPSELAFGLVPVGEWRWGDAWIWNFSSKDITLRQHALINPVTGVELDESASPLVLVPIPHSGMHVKASSYANIRVLFKPTAPEPVRATWRVRFETDTYLDPNKPPEIIQTFISASGWGGLSRLPNIPRPSELKLPAAVRRILERQLFGRRR